MKRKGNLWTKIIDKSNLYLAFEKAKRHKSWQRKVKIIEANLDYYIEKLQNDLITGQYKTAEYKLKTIYEPKKRDIYILPFYPDRIVHHAIMNVLEPIWDNRFIYDKSVPADKRCKKTLNLLDEIIDSVDTPVNVPIGNYLSQWFGNLYLNELDVFLKQKNCVKNYLRYCDDFLLFSDDKTYLNKMAKTINEYVVNILELKLSKCVLFPTAQGVDFLGYRHFHAGYVLVRKSTAKRMKRRIKRLKYELLKNKISKDKALSVVASLSGWLRWANSYNLRMFLELESLKKELGGNS